MTPKKRENPLKKIYDWVLHWAETPYGTPALFLLAFAESSFFPIPPDVLLIALSIAKPKRSFRYALICSAGSILGGMLGYFIGWGFWEVTREFFFTWVPGFTEHGFEMIAQKYDEWNFWVVFTAGFTPVPYKIITISAGVFRIGFPLFVVASVVSRSTRFFIVGGLIFKFGGPIKSFIDRYFNILSLLFIVLLVLGFLAFKLL